MSLAAGLRAPEAGTVALAGRPVATAGSRRPARPRPGAPDDRALLRAHRRGKPPDLRRAPGSARLRTAGRARRRPRRRAARRPPPLARENLFRRHATPAQPRRRAAAPPEAPALRRAHRRRRSAVAQRHLRIPRSSSIAPGSRSSTPRTTWRRPSGLCSRIGIIDHGKILALGTLDELLTQLPFEDEITFPVTPPLRRWWPALAAEGEITAVDGTHRFRPRTGYPLSAFFALTESLNLPPRLFVSQRPTLEALFLHLTGRTLRDA